MGICLNPDNRLFQEMLNGQFYVDKTKLAQFVNGTICTPRKYTCVSRPRRFGKSADADMLVAYYSKGADSREQFANLFVATIPEYKLHLNSHDVIKLDMTHILPHANGFADIGRHVERPLP